MKAPLIIVAAAALIIPSTAPAVEPPPCVVTVGPVEPAIDAHNNVEGIVHYRVHGRQNRRVSMVADIRRADLLEWRVTGSGIGEPGWNFAGITQQVPLTWASTRIVFRIEVRACGVRTVRYGAATTVANPTTGNEAATS